MDIDVFAPGELPDVLRTLRTAMNPDGVLAERELRLLATYARICGQPLPDIVPPIRVAAVQVEGEHRRRRLLQLAAIAALLHQPVRPPSVAWVYALARHL